MVGHGLDLVVEDVAVAVDRLAADLAVEGQAVGGDMHVEARVEAVAGLTTEDQVVEPGDEQVGRRVGPERDGLGRLGSSGSITRQNSCQRPT